MAIEESPASLSPRVKFEHPEYTADGSRRAEISFDGLHTLWLNTGTLCNIECAACYIESSPTNDRLVYLSAEDARPFLDEARAMGAKEVGFTGGEPFMNPDILALIKASLARGFLATILTNGMKPMMRPKMQVGLLRLRGRYGRRLRLRVSLDHYAAGAHDGERAAGSFTAALESLVWLAAYGFSISVAGRIKWGETESQMRAGFTELFGAHKIPIDAQDRTQLVLFPEMDETQDVPEITTKCWKTLGVDPKSIMCASARMVVKRKGAAAPSVLACTLIPYHAQFEMGGSLRDAVRPVFLNHPHCAWFCVLGGANCSTE